MNSVVHSLAALKIHNLDTHVPRFKCFITWTIVDSGGGATRISFRKNSDIANRFDLLRCRRRTRQTPVHTTRNMCKPSEAISNIRCNLDIARIFETRLQETGMPDFVLGTTNRKVSAIIVWHNATSSKCHFYLVLRILHFSVLSQTRFVWLC